MSGAAAGLGLGFFEREAARKAKEDKVKDEEEQTLLRLTPWAQTIERDREVCVLFPDRKSVV